MFIDTIYLFVSSILVFGLESVFDFVDKVMKIWVP